MLAICADFEQAMFLIAEVPSKSQSIARISS